MMEHIVVKNRELAERSLGGITVRLFWREGTMPPETFVTYDDEKTGDYFTIEVAHTGQSPNEVYNHPNVYRDFRGVEK